MAISTYKTYLMHKGSTASAYEKLIDISEFPDLGGDPEMIDVTTLSDPMKVFVLGIQGNDGFKFSGNYSHADYAKVKALEGAEQQFAVWFGATTSNNVDTPTGSDGKYSFKGYIGVYVAGGGVNDKVGLNITIAPTTRVSDETT